METLKIMHNIKFSHTNYLWDTLMYMTFLNSKKIELKMRGHPFITSSKKYELFGPPPQLIFFDLPGSIITLSAARNSWAAASCLSATLALLTELLVSPDL